MIDSDPTASLVERLRRGEFSDADWEVTIRTIQIQGVPASEVRNIRDKALRSYREAEYPHENDIRARARNVRIDVSRYAASAWRQHQHHHLVPAEIAGSAFEHLWRALKHGALKIGPRGAEIISEGQLCRIL